MSQPVLFLPQPQTEQVGGVYQCGHLVKGVDQELKVQFTLMGRGQAVGKLSLTVSVSLQESELGATSSGALCSAYEIW